MRDIPSYINAGLIFDGILFDTYLDRARYIRAEGQRRRWLEQNPGKWRRLNDVLHPAVPPMSQDSERARTPASVSAAGDGGSGASKAQARPTMVVVRLPNLQKNQIEIAGHLYVCGRYLASMLGISERTLSRRFADGNGPPHVKLARIYYDLNKVQEWTAEKPQRRGLCGQKQEILDRECVADLAGLEAATIRQKKRLLCAGRIVDRVAARKPVSQTDGPISDG